MCNKHLRDDSEKSQRVFTSLKNGIIIRYVITFLLKNVESGNQKLDSMLSWKQAPRPVDFATSVLGPLKSHHISSVKNRPLAPPHPTHHTSSCLSDHKVKGGVWAQEDGLAVVCLLLLSFMCDSDLGLDILKISLYRFL